jgi:hypothetical protein
MAERHVGRGAGGAVAAGVAGSAAGAAGGIAGLLVVGRIGVSERLQRVVDIDCVLECGDCGYDGWDLYGYRDGDEWNSFRGGSGDGERYGELGGGPPSPPKGLFGVKYSIQEG